MALILNEVYVGYSNLWRYGLNRILRIFPVYWAILGLALLLTVLGADSLFSIGSTKLDMMAKPDSVQELIGNILLVLPWDSQLTISQSWSLRIELVFYLLMVFLVRKWWVVAIWFMISAIYCAYQIHHQVLFLKLYSTVTGASIAFSLGAGIYYLSQKVKLANFHLLIATVFFISHLVFAPSIWNFQHEGQALEMLFQRSHFGLYANVLLAGYVIWAIYSFESKNKIPLLLKSTGQTLGNIAYAIFLIHWIAAVIVINSGVAFDNKQIFVPLALIVTHILAIGFNKFVERPINEKLRDRLRPPRPMIG